MLSDLPPAYDSALSKKLTPASMRGVETFHRGVDAELVAERDPRTEGQHTDLEAAAAETSIFHDADRTLAGVLLAVVVDTSRAVARDAFAQGEDRRARGRCCATCAPDEVATVVCLLTGEPRQGRIGVGWATLSTRARPRERSESRRP